MMQHLAELQDAQAPIQALIHNIDKVVKGKNDKIILVLTALFAGGHILIEDNPGTGKTVLAKTLAQSIQQTNNQTFKRVQFTPDLLPMDLLGTHIFDDREKDFLFKKGPLFCNILLADEINRASPKVQSALLECMAEGQITVGELTYKLEDVFFTIATQNPIEMEGTYPLPAAQLDRFAMKINFGYVDETTELDILTNYAKMHNQLNVIEPVIDIATIRIIQSFCNEIVIHPELIQSVSNIIRNSRTDDGITLGASTRAGIAFMKCLKAYALVNNRSFVVEQDLIEIAPHILNHRLIFNNQQIASTWLDNQLQKEQERLRKIKI